MLQPYLLAQMGQSEPAVRPDLLRLAYNGGVAEMNTDATNTGATNEAAWDGITERRSGLDRRGPRPGVPERRKNRCGMCAVFPLELAMADPKKIWQCTVRDIPVAAETYGCPQFRKRGLL